MIAKNIKAQSFAGVVNYVIKKDAEVLKAEGVMALSAKSMITSFELQQSVRSEIKSPVGHIPISFVPEDKERMTNEFMLQLAEEYMQNMNIKNTQYIIVRHHDNPNEHIHIVYNRIDNNGKLITDKNDYKRNIATCKKLKDKYNLTYGKDKSRVKIDKLRGSERTKHEIFHAVKDEITSCRTFAELQNCLDLQGVSIEFKYRRGTNEIQGISFTKDNCTFKGSQIDRKFSYTHLNTTLNKNFKHRIPIALGGIKLADEQRTTLDDGKTIYIENMANKSGEIYNAWVKWSDEHDKLQFYKRDPDTLYQPTSQIQQPSQEQSQQDSSFISGGLGGIFDLPTDGGDDPEETQFRNRMQQQQRKKKGVKR